MMACSPTTPQAARALGVTRARVTQIMNLLLLAPEIQEQVFGGEIWASERRLRCAVREPVWEWQVAMSLE